MPFPPPYRPARWTTRSPWSAQSPACSPELTRLAWTSRRPARWRCTMGSRWTGSWPSRTSPMSPTSAHCCCTLTPSSTTFLGMSRPSSTLRKTCWLSMWVDWPDHRKGWLSVWVDWPDHRKGWLSVWVDWPDHRKGWLSVWVDWPYRM